MKKKLNIFFVLSFIITAFFVSCNTGINIQPKLERNQSEKQFTEKNTGNMVKVYPAFNFPGGAEKSSRTALPDNSYKIEDFDIEDLDMVEIYFFEKPYIIRHPYLFHGTGKELSDFMESGFEISSGTYGFRFRGTIYKRDNEGNIILSEDGSPFPNVTFYARTDYINISEDNDNIISFEIIPRKFYDKDEFIESKLTIKLNLPFLTDENSSGFSYDASIYTLNRNGDYDEVSKKPCSSELKDEDSGKVLYITSPLNFYDKQNLYVKIILKNMNTYQKQMYIYETTAIMFEGEDSYEEATIEKLHDAFEAWIFPQEESEYSVFYIPGYKITLPETDVYSKYKYIWYTDEEKKTLYDPQNLYTGQLTLYAEKVEKTAYNIYVYDADTRELYQTIPIYEGQRFQVNSEEIMVNGDNRFEHKPESRAQYFTFEDGNRVPVYQTQICSGDISVYAKFVPSFEFYIHTGDSVISESIPYIKSYQFRFDERNNLILITEESYDSGVCSNTTEGIEIETETEEHKVYLDSEYTEELELDKYYDIDPTKRTYHFYLKPLTYKVVFDPYKTDCYFGDGMEFVDIEGKRYLKVIVDGYNNFIYRYSSINLSGCTSFKAEMFGTEGNEAFNYSVKLMDSEFKDISLITMDSITDVLTDCSSGIAKNESWKSDTMVCDNIQLFVQENTEPYGVQSGVVVYLGKVIAEFE